MVPQIVFSWMDGGRRRWAAFPGLSCYLPLGRGRLDLTGKKPMTVSQSFSLGWPPSLSGTPTSASPPPWYTASSVTVRHACTGLPGSCWPGEKERGCLPSLEGLFWSEVEGTQLTWSLLLSHNMICIAGWGFFVWGGFHTSPHFPQRLAPLFLI